MKKISSRTTFLTKRVSPALYFGFLAFFFVAFVVERSAEPSYLIVLALLTLALAGFVAMRKYVWSLADEVYDLGDHLLVIKSGYEEKVALADIENVSVSRHQNPQRVTLRLRGPGRLGSRIMFAPTTHFTLNPFAMNPVAQDLIARVDLARGRRAA